MFFAWFAGRFGDLDEITWPEIRDSLEIVVTPPQVEVRDPEKETRVRQILNAAGVLSKKTWAAQESLDWEQEQRNLAEEAQADAALQAKLRPDDRDAPRPGASTGEQLEADWDAAKHPRGGNPANRGEFSKEWGGGIESPAARGGSVTATSGLHIAPSEQTPDRASTTDVADPDGEQVTRLDIPGRQYVLLQRDAEALAKLAADIFRNEPIELWPARALEALQQLQSALGRPLARDLAEKFLEYVKAVQENAKLRREFEEALRKLSRLASQQFGGDREATEVILDLTQMGLDLAGTVDPTPTADGFNALISLSRGDLTGAGISAISMIAYFGDLAKLAKLAEYPKKLARAIKLALKSEKFAELLTPVLRKLHELLRRIPLEKLPDGIRRPLENLKNQLENFFRKVDGPNGNDPPIHPSGSPKRVSAEELEKARKEFERLKPKAWKEEAAAHPERYTADQLSRMRKGQAPIGSDGHPMEIHHNTPLAEGGSNRFDNFDFMTRTEHRLGENYKKNHPNLP